MDCMEILKKRETARIGRERLYAWSVTKRRSNRGTDIGLSFDIFCDTYSRAKNIRDSGYIDPPRPFMKGRSREQNRKINLIPRPGPSYQRGDSLKLLSIRYIQVNNQI